MVHFAIKCMCFATAVLSKPLRGPGDLPVVDLGYSVHQALAFNDVGGYYNFSNIRFGMSTEGENRFRAPQAPKGWSRAVTNGGPNNIVCPSVMPTWMEQVDQQVGLLETALAEHNTTFLDDVLDGVFENATMPTASKPASVDGVTEDCLFLDLVLPKNAWDNRENCTKGAPVIVWLFGGGYTSGNKRDVDNPNVGANVAGGLVSRSIASEQDNIEPAIVVLPNYRLGLFGWLAGDEVAANGTPNAGLLDQRLAMEWVQKYIHLFGGDPARVTAMGQSSGAGSLEHHITSYGGEKGPLPFQRAILQSPIFYPQPADSSRPNEVFRSVLRMTNTSTLDDLRNTSSEVLQVVNRELIGKSSYGYFTFGPVVDGIYVPALPGKLLAEGRYHKNIPQILGHNKNDPFVFINPAIKNTTAAFKPLVRLPYPEANQTSLHLIENTLLPPDYSGAEGYITTFGRQNAFFNTTQMICNNLFLAKAQPDITYWYDFDVLPAYHTQDLAYTWADYPPSSGEGFVAKIATALQEYILSFVAEGIPISLTAAHSFEPYGNNDWMLRLQIDGTVLPSQTKIISRTCSPWQSAPYTN